jgi:hypothetical protein
MPEVGKRGLIWHDPARYAPRLEDYRTVGPLKVTGLPPANGDVDRCSEIDPRTWFMFGNNQVGDCVEAMMLHADMAVSAYAGHPVRYNDSYGIELYSAITGYVPGDPNTDNGTDIQTALEYWKNTGLVAIDGSVHKIAGYAQFGNPADEILLAQVLNTFGTVLVGVSLQQAQEDQFSNGQPWDYVEGDPFIGGHGIALQRRAVGGVGTLRYITWGAVQPATRKFQYFCTGHGNGEAWAVVTQDWLDANGDSIEGLNLQQLISDLQYVPQG